MSNDPASVPAAEVWTVRRIIEWTTQHLKKHGSETPRLDAEVLLAHVRKSPRIQLYVQFDTPLSDTERATMRDLVQRRVKSEPVAYLVGHREFFSLDFRVTHDVLIPRPETETLVVEAIDAGKGREQPRILDVGTGSGCIAVCCAVRLPQARVTAIDISPAALAVARENATRHKVADRIEFLEGNLLAPLPAEARFDVIVSNPPYVAEGEMNSLPADIRLHEPQLALRSGSDGLNALRQLIAEAPRFLKAGGLLAVEFSPEQAPAVTQLFEQTGMFSDLKLIKDAAGKPRVLRGVRTATGGA